MQRAEPAVDYPPTRRPVAPRVADREVLRAPLPIEPPVVISPEDNPLRGWRRIPAIPLVDFAWRRGVEHNAVACYLAGRRRGGTSEAVMAMLPFIVVIAAFGWLMAEIPHPREVIWVLAIMLALVLQPLAVVMGALLMGWGLRRYLGGLSVEQLLSTRLKPEEILRGLAIRPVCRITGIAMIASLWVPLLVAVAVIRSAHPFSWEWMALGFLGLLVAFFGGVMGGQLGAAMALRAHIYLRNSAMATVRAFFDLFALFARLFLFALLICWLCGFVVLGAHMITWNSPAAFLGLGRLGAAGIMDNILILLLLAAVGFVLIWGTFYAGYIVLIGLLRSLETAVEFTYLYPEEWWMTNPGRDAAEDTYRPGVPWIAPHSEMMERFRSRACGK